MSFLLPLKPYVTALVMPLCAGLLALFFSALWARRKATSVSLRRGLLALGAGVCLVLWVLSCQAVAVALAQHLLPRVPTITAQELKDQKIQAIVVLGGGALRNVPEYQGHALGSESMARLMYGLHLQRHAQIPLAFTGGIGWADTDRKVSEAEIAAESLERLGLPPVRWLEGASRDTQQNAQYTQALLKSEGVTRIALVTNGWHMPRALREFEAVGFEHVLPAPMGFIRVDQLSLFDFLPSPGGLNNSQVVLREWLGLLVARLRGI